MSAAVVYEVAVPFLELTDPRGHKHYLKAGADLPAWVSEQTCTELREAGALNEFGAI